MKSSEYAGREQTEVKHQVLRRYLSEAIPIVGSWAADIAYIDCLAGPWESAAEDFSDTSFATAVQVLRSTRETLHKRGRAPHFRCLFVERDKPAYDRLKKYADSLTDVGARAENWDFTQSVDKIASFAKDRKKSFPFVFIDPKGWEPIAIPLITPLLLLDPGEVLITLMTSFIRRFVNVQAKGFDKILGQHVVEELKSQEGQELEEKLVSLYTLEAKNAGGFPFACTLPVLKASTDDFQFYIVYLTRHRRGVEVFKETERMIIPFMHLTRAEGQSRRRLERTGQFPLLPPTEEYKESRFTNFRARQLNLVHQALMRLIQKGNRFSYGEAWDIVMQNAAVLEDDLRGWILELRDTGKIQIPDWHERQRFPRKENTIVVT